MRILETETTTEFEAKQSLACLKGLLQQCEKELLQLSLLEEQGMRLANNPFYTSMFRYLWTKLTASLLKQAEFYGKGTGC